MKHILLSLTLATVIIVESRGATDGTLAWKTYIGSNTPSRVVGSPAIKADGSNSRVFGISGNTIKSLNYNDGSQNWSLTYDNRIHTVILNASKNLIYVNKGRIPGVGTNNGAVHCVTAYGGAQMWNFEGTHNGNEYYFSDRIALGIDYNGADLIYALGYREDLVNDIPVLWCIDSYGNAKWLRDDLPSAGNPGIGTGGDISIGSNGELYIQTLNDIHRIHGQFGFSEWSYNISSTDQRRISSPISIDNNGNLYFMITDDAGGFAGSEYLMSLTSSGLLRWEKYISNSISGIHEPLVGSDGTVYVMSYQASFQQLGYPILTALNTSNGTIKWQSDYDDGETFISTILDNNNNIILAMNGLNGSASRILSINAQNGTSVNWSFTDNNSLSDINSGLNIDNGYMYFTTKTHMYALNYSKDIQLGNWPKMQKAIKSQSYKGSSYQ